MRLGELILKNGNILIELPGAGEVKVGEKSLWIPRNSVAKGVVYGTIKARCSSVEDPDFEVGARVMANRFNTGIEIEIDGETMHLLTAGNIIAVVQDEKLKGKGGNVIVHIPDEEITETGLYLSKKATYGRAIAGPIEAAGDEVQDEDIAEGRVAIFERNAATEIEVGPKKLFIVDANELIGVEATSGT